MKPKVDENKSKFEFGRPDAALLEVFCQERFGWCPVRCPALTCTRGRKAQQDERQLTCIAR